MSSISIFFIFVFVTIQNPIRKTAALHLFKLFKEGGRINLCIALGAHTFNNCAVIDLYGFGFDVTHNDCGCV